MKGLYARWIGRAGRVMCALAVALVTTFHVCDVASARSVDLVITDSAEKQTVDFVAVEKCHTCAVVGFFATAVSSRADTNHTPIPPGAVLSLVPFHEPAIGPPPRT